MVDYFIFQSFNHYPAISLSPEVLGMKSNRISIAMFYLAALLGGIGCNSRSNDDRLNTENPRSESDSLQEVTSDATSGNSANQSENRESQRLRAVASGRENPETMEELAIQQRNCAKSLDELGYTSRATGIMRGRVLLCGRIMSPPFTVDCDSSDFSFAYVLRVNGAVFLSRSLNYGYPDSCGTMLMPETAFNGNTSRLPLACKSLVLDRLRELAASLRPVIAEKGIDGAQRVVDDASESLKRIECIANQSEKVFGVVKVGLSRTGATLYAHLFEVAGLGIYEFPITTKETEGRPTLGTGQDICSIQKSRIENALGSGMLVISHGDHATVMSELEYNAKISSILNSQMLDDLKKRSLLSRVSGEHPECLLLRNNIVSR